MKFGGTSLADAECVARTAAIISNAWREAGIVAVVSAQSGVTNNLVQAARLSENGDQKSFTSITSLLAQHHELAINELIQDPNKRSYLIDEATQLINNAVALCQGTALLRELTPRALDSICGIGEQLSARLLAATLCQMGVRSRGIDATAVIVTNDAHGQAEPLMEETRQRAALCLLPLLEEGILPVVTGFIGATAQGRATTLGRGGSDYSATILGAALNAEEVIIWTDVNGVMTADPRLVPDARTLSEISYAEAAELAYFGAKVLHPKTLRPVTEAGIKVQIRNSFEPERPGTRIVRHTNRTANGVKAITAIRDVDLITVGGRGMVGIPDVVARTFAATAKAETNILLISQSSSQNDICFVVNSADTKHTIEALRHKFATHSRNEVEHINVDSDVAIVAVIGERMRGVPGIAGRVFSALGRERINVIAIAQGASEYNVSLVVEAKAMQKAVITLHREFRLGQTNPAPADLEVHP